MSFSYKLNSITGKFVMESARTPNLDSTYYENILEGSNFLRSYSGLAQSILQRFPFQPKVPGFHPALKYNFQMIKIMSGAIFRFKMKRLEEQFNRIQKEDARVKNNQFRFIIRKIRDEIETELKRMRSLEDQERYYYKLFEDKAIKRLIHTEKNIENHTEKKVLRKKQLEEWTKKIHKATDNLRETYTLMDKERYQSTRNYWNTYDKNRETNARIVSMGGTSLQSILNELPWSEASSLWRIYSVVKRNRLKIHASQIAESYDGALPTELIGRSVYFNRRIWEQIQRSAKKHEIFTDHRNNNEEISIQNKMNNKIRFDDFVQRNKKSKQEFYDNWDKNNEPLPFNINLGSMNHTAALQQYNRTASPAVNALQEKIKDTRMIASADNLISSMSASIPSEVLFNYGVFNHHRIQRKPYDPQDRKVRLRERRLEVAYDKQKDNYILRKVEISKEEREFDRIKVNLSNRYKLQDMQRSLDFKQAYTTADSSCLNDNLTNERAPRLNPEKTGQIRRLKEKIAPMYDHVMRFGVGYSDDRDRADLQSVTAFHVLRRNQSRTEDAAKNDSDKARMKANTHNLIYKERSGGTDQYYRNKWSSNHNESLIPINYQDMLSYQQLTLITDHPGADSKNESVREIIQAHSSKVVKREG